MTRNLKAPSPIYFSATLSSTFITTKSSDILVYNNVITNKGNGYNPSNGTFVCPRDGTYLIAYSVLNKRQNTLHAYLRINGSDKIKAVARGDHTFTSAERVSIHELRKGDQVNVIVSEQGSQVFGYSFSNFAATYIPG
ncbi:hypothetical protein FSP39_006768 [Pinctada imbricata]|uniref:C1q domain-containing protein n=1 Tax=Pinctada imbricata TaxID=66713 RepID=A0AA88YCK4_PINIB|nr:hypothetical protein FSP39_006768 [Pinctada imbricata]